MYACGIGGRLVGRINGGPGNELRGITLVGSGELMYLTQIGLEVGHPALKSPPHLSALQALHEGGETGLWRGSIGRARTRAEPLPNVADLLHRGVPSELARSKVHGVEDDTRHLQDFVGNYIAGQWRICSGRQEYVMPRVGQRVVVQAEVPARNPGRGCACDGALIVLDIVEKCEIVCLGEIVPGKFKISRQVAMYIVRRPRNEGRRRDALCQSNEGVNTVSVVG